MLQIYADKLKSLTVFRGILKDETIHKLLSMLSCPDLDSYADFVSSLYQHTDCLSDYILKVVLEDENVFMKKLAELKEVSFCIKDSVKNELDVLSEIAQLNSDDVKSSLIKAGISSEIYLAKWRTAPLDLAEKYSERMNELSTRGYGIFAEFNAFTFKDSKLIPVVNPDSQRLSDLTGYELERGKIINNTIALLNNKPAANALLYGDAGTGKSSTVKAVANEYAEKGLRLIEIKKHQIADLPEIIAAVAKNPLKFIVFIDDVSFSSDDDSFGTLKAVLEGSVTTKTPNIVIYATSNRRHLVREKFSDRDGDEIHAGDTREQMSSLSERFGLKVPFLKPNKDVYLRIVENLAAQYDIPCDESLFNKAEVFSLRRNGRSGRAAKHFIESILAEIQ